MIEAKMVADSLGEYGDRISTMIVTFPRIILAELNTHRMLSKNSASSRAIPFDKMVKSVQENPFIPIAWQRDHKGMQGTEYWTDNDTVTVDEGDEYEHNSKIYSATENFITTWLEARDEAVAHSAEMNRLGLTKQLCNRLLEPFMWHTVLITAIEFENFFALRCPQYIDPQGKLFRSKKNYLSGSDWEGANQWGQLDWLQVNAGQAEIHMMALAEAMWDCMNESKPKELKAGEWHIPYGENINPPQMFTKEGLEQFKVKIATARCARVSYTLVGDEEKEANYENDIKLHDRLAKSGHWSPFEHCAKAMSSEEYDSWHRGNSKQTGGLGWCGNFKGFIQYRKLFENENITR